MRRAVSAWGGLLALIVVCGLALPATAEDAITLLDDPLLVPQDWQAKQVGDSATDASYTLSDPSVMDPFHGRDALADPWSAAGANADGAAPSCACACSDVLVPADWR